MPLPAPPPASAVILHVPPPVLALPLPAPAASFPGRCTGRNTGSSGVAAGRPGSSCDGAAADAPAAGAFAAALYAGSDGEGFPVADAAGVAGLAATAPAALAGLSYGIISCCRMSAAGESPRRSGDRPAGSRVSQEVHKRCETRRVACRPVGVGGERGTQPPAAAAHFCLPSQDKQGRARVGAHVLTRMCGRVNTRVWRRCGVTCMMR
mmetsp:Transcript_16942/g.50795  ORF Transcript_16942/g.50795 Transcript_16942/m.50795 type:complete len:208 (-) Transcript_16942:30-653(-)|eukprot:365277-Chlamydomonas_euryale.AAC.25